MSQKLVVAWITAGVALASAAIGVAGGIYAANAGLTGIDRQIDVKMVEIAVGILSQEPRDNIAPAREWAVDVIDHYAHVPLRPEVRTALVNNKALRAIYDLGFFGTSIDYGGKGYPEAR